MALTATDILQALSDAGYTKADLANLFKGFKIIKLNERQRVLLTNLTINGAWTDAESSEYTTNQATLDQLGG